MGCVGGGNVFPALGGVKTPSLCSLCLALDLPTSAGPGGSHPAQEAPRAVPWDLQPSSQSFCSAHDPITSPRCSLTPGATGDAAVGSTKDRGGFGGGSTPPSCPTPGSNPTPAATWEQVSISGRVGEGGSASAKSRPRAPLTSPGATAQPRRCFCCRWNSSSQGWRNPGAEQPVPRRGCRGRGTAHPPGHCETQTPMHRDGLGTVGKVQLPAVALLWELRSHSGPGEEAWGHGTLPVGPPTPHVMDAVSTGVFRGHRAPLSLSRVPRSPRAAQGVIWLLSLQTPFSLCPAPGFTSQGTSSIPAPICSPRAR